MVQSFVALCLLLWIGHFARMHVRVLRQLYLPSSVIGGLLGLVAILAVKSAAGLPEAGWWPDDGVFPALGGVLTAAKVEVSRTWTAGWSRLPGFLINIVFACLFLGVRIPRVSELWRRAGPQLAYGQVVAWGQYVVGVGLVIVLLGPLFGVNPMFGGIIPVGFEGGHGTASGMAETFRSLNWPEGKDLGLASATAGIVSAVIVGMILVNWAVRRGYTARRSSPEKVPEDASVGVIPVDRRPIAGRLTVSTDVVGALSLHLAIVGLAVGIGYAIQQALVGIGALTGSTTVRRIMSAFPLFPLCMIGGMLVQIVEDRLERHSIIDPGLTRRIQNAALDFLIVAAIATINIYVVAAALPPFLIVVAAAIAWNVFCLMVLAKRMLPDAWFERAIAELGQSMGVTATGLLLLRVVDPEYETPAADAFASKQLLHEPFMGGGLWTSTAIPLLAMYGCWPVFLIACGAVAFWLALVFGVKAARRKRA